MRYFSFNGRTRFCGFDKKIYCDLVWKRRFFDFNRITKFIDFGAKTHFCGFGEKPDFMIVVETTFCNFGKKKEDLTILAKNTILWF